MSRERLVDKIRALLEKAKRTEHEPERDAFLAKAQAMITRHQIDEAELNEAKSAMVERQVIVRDWGNATKGVVHLYSGVAAINCCSVVHQSGRGFATVIMWGSELNAEITCTLVDYLLPQLRADILRDRPRSRVSYSVGWAAEVCERLEAAQTSEVINRMSADQPVSNGTGESPTDVDLSDEATSAAFNALVPTNTEADDALKQNYNVRRARRTEVKLDEFGLGALAGESADLGQTKLQKNPDEVSLPAGG